MAKAAKRKTDKAAGPKIIKGLVGVYADTTAVSKVMPETNSLTYRGYAVQDLAAKCEFEEVAYLLLYGELPRKSQYAGFKKKERSRRALTKSHQNVIAEFSKSAHPMDTLRTAVSYLGTTDMAWGGEAARKDLDRAIDLLAKIPTMIAIDYRLRSGLRPIRPKTNLSMSENFFHMCFGNVPPAEVIRAFNVSLILYAEHSFNASTFTARVITSTRSDIYSAVTGGIGALKGPLHGGANERVLDQLEAIGEAENVRPWVNERLSHKGKVMGFGHRVYKTKDPRSKVLQHLGKQVFEELGETPMYELALELERVMDEKVGHKGICPNVDFFSGLLYQKLEIPTDLFTPIFGIARVSGYMAHWLEQMPDNRIFRPTQIYLGEREASYVPMSERG